MHAAKWIALSDSARRDQADNSDVRVLLVSMRSTVQGHLTAALQIQSDL